jgi:RNA polymerase sigma factor (TIGR02999 family)
MSSISSSSPGEGPFRGLTALLAAVASGDQDAVSRLWSLVHADVRQMAASVLRGERVTDGMAPTVLVHEAWLRLHGRDGSASFENRRHFFGAIATTMRRVLVDHARARRSQKRGGGARPVPLQIVEGELAAVGGSDAAMLEEVMAALDTLAARHPRAAEVARLRYLLGLEVDVVAGLLDISPRTVRADWTFAKAWLRRAIDDQGD